MKKLLIVLAPLFLSLVAFTPSMDFTVSGKITDDKGSPIPFASIVEKGTKNGVTADANGKFTLKVSSEKATIIISSVGFDDKEIKLKGSTTVAVSLNPTKIETKNIL